jgi:O-antigen/teichoic acid export membrane protein
MKDNPTVKNERFLRERFFNGINWAILTSIIGQGSVFLVTVITARLLGTASYGEWSIAQSTAISAVLTASAGIGVTASKFVSENRITNPLKAGRLLKLSLFIALIIGSIYAITLLASAHWIADTLLHAPHLTRSLRISSIYVLFWSMVISQIGVLNGLEAFSRLTRISLYYAMGAFVLSIALTWRFGLEGAATAMSLSSIIAYWLYRQAIKRECKDKGITMQWCGMWNEWQVLFQMSLPAGISGIVAAAFVWGSNTVLAQRTNGMHEMAIFNASYALRNLILFVPALIAKVASPILSNLKGVDDSEGYKRLLRVNFKLTVAIAFAIAVIVGVLSRLLLGAYGTEFAIGYHVLMILALSAALETIAVGLYQSLFANGKWWSGLVVSSGWSLVLFGTFYAWLQSEGAKGLAMAYVLAWIFSSLAYGVVAWKLESNKRHMNIRGEKTI